MLIRVRRGCTKYDPPTMMGQVFGAFAALEPRDRFLLGSCLHDSSTCFPVTEEDFALLPVPSAGSSTAAFLHHVRNALVPVLDSELRSWTLGELVPRIAAMTDVVQSCSEATNRLAALVRSNGHRTWGGLSGCTVGEIRDWYGAGQQLTSQLVTAAVATALRSAHGESNTAHPPRGNSPDPVCAALEGFLAELPDARGRFAFELDELRIDETRTSSNRPAAHEFLGLSFERTRQLKAAAREQLLTAAGQDAAVEQRRHALAARLGLAADHDGFESALRALELPSTSDPAGLLAVWLAGPYRPVPGHVGWWSPRPVELVDETRNLLAMDGGVQPREVLIKDLGRVGVVEGHAERWLSDQRVKIENGLVVHLSGRTVDVAARVLESTGRAMSSSELCAWMPPEITPPVLGHELNRNPAFVETGPDRWELSDWGGEPSQHLVRIEVQVTSEVVSGAEADLADEVAVVLHLRPRTAITLATRFGPLVVSYDGRRVRRGSARPIVLASGAETGDLLSFVVDPRDLAVEVTVGPATIQSSSRVRSTV